MTLESRERAIGGRFVQEQNGFPKHRILLMALKRELAERKPHELNDATVRRLVIETYRAITLDY